MTNSPLADVICINFYLMLIMLTFGIEDVNTYTGIGPTEISHKSLPQSLTTNLIVMQMFDNPAPSRH